MVAPTGPSWAAIWSRLELIDVDFQQVYGLDFWDCMARRTARWMRVRVMGLLSTDSRLQRVLSPRKEQSR